MALLALAHGDARAVPEALRRLGGLVVVVAAGAQGGPELVLVLCEALDDDGGDGLVDAEVGAGAVVGWLVGGEGGGGGGSGKKDKRFLVFFFPVVVVVVENKLAAATREKKKPSFHETGKSRNKLF